MTLSRHSAVQDHCGDRRPSSDWRLRLDRGCQALDQRCLVERFAQEPECSAFSRTVAVALIRIGCNQNYRRAIPARPQRFLQLKAVEARHLQVGNQACRFPDHIGPKEMLRRAESNGLVSQGLDEFPYTISGQRVVVHDRDQRVFTSQDCTYGYGGREIIRSKNK
jgi:hypothetical protein